MEDLTYREYWQEIRSLAKDARKEEFENGQEASEWLHETIDGHEWVIYTHYNLQVLRWSKNSDYVADNFGAESLVANGQLNLAAIAYGCLYGDVMEALGDPMPDCIDPASEEREQHGKCRDQWIETGEGECVTDGE